MKAHGSFAWAYCAAAIAQGFWLNAPALAQEASKAPSSGVEEIVVTAQKRAQRLQDVPIAITSFSADTLESQQLDGLFDVASSVPNFSVSRKSVIGASNGFTFMRGVGTDNNQYTLDPAIGVYVNGSYRARAYGVNADFLDAERVEILRGPQGTLYGRNNSVGAIRIISRNPSLSGTDVNATVSAGSFGLFELDAGASVALVEDQLGLRVALRHVSDDGAQKNANSVGGTALKQDQTTGRATLLWRPDDRLSITARLEYLKDEGPGTAAVPLTQVDLFTYNSNIRLASDLEEVGGSVEIDYEIGDGLSLTSITQYRDVSLLFSYNLDSVAAAQFEIDPNDINSKYWTQEIYLTGEKIGSMPVEWVAGAFYYQEEIDESVITKILGGGAPALRSLEADSVAVYAQGSFPISDDLTGTLGVRYSDESKTFDLDTRVAGVREFADSKTTWRAGLDHKLTDDVLLYGVASTGFRSGGFDINTGNPFATEEVETYEGGVKSEFFDNRLRINAGYYFNNFTNLQQSVIDPNSPTGLGTVTLDAESDGFELEVAAVPMDGLTLMGNIGTINSVVTKPARTGWSLKQSPDYTYRIGAEKEFLLGSAGSLVFNASYDYTDDYFVNTDNNPAGLIEGFGLVDARIAYKSVDERFVVAIEGTNLTDEDQPTFRFVLPIPFLTSRVNNFPQPPRVVKATLSFRF